jgi:rare lipoprotein A
MRSNNKRAALGAALGGALLLSLHHPAHGLPPRPSVAAPYRDRDDAEPRGEWVGYDEVGYAGVYGQDGDGGPTASDEPFVAAGISAAHRTLPLPSYVEVTALASGKTILARVNDRGPAASGRLIDLSPGAAAQLGIDGTAPVRVRRVNPPEQEKAVLRAHGRAAERLETPEAVLVVLRQRLAAPPSASRPPVPPASPTPPPAKPAARPSSKPPIQSTAGADFDAPPPKAEKRPPPAPAGKRDGFVIEGEGAPAGPDRSSTAHKPPSASNPTLKTPKASAPPPPPASAPRAAAGGYSVQVAAFASRDRAQALARRIGGDAVQAGDVWRVRLGPYATQDAARAGVRQAASKGFENARIMANDAR